MSEQIKEESYADRAMARLKKLARGNGLSPDAIQLIEKEEKVFHVNAALAMTAKMGIETGHYPGGIKTAKCQVFPNIGMLREAVGSKQQKFEQGSEWINEAIAELEKAPAQGWGLDGATITLPSSHEVLAAAETCPSCNGQTRHTCQTCQGEQRLVCPQCSGRLKEMCLNCYGHCKDPNNQDKDCYLCHGTGFMVCRQCQGTGTLVCPTCHGQGGTACPDCRGTGKITEEVHLTGGAVTAFRLLEVVELPSGFLRSLDRLGIVNLPKGHGTVTMTPPKPNEEDPKASTTVSYVAQVPFADMKIKFGDDRASLVSSFGLKGVLLGVPPFLDEPLKPARKILRQVALKGGSLRSIQKCRAVDDVLTLTLDGRGGDNPAGLRELRRLYSVGLSPDVMHELLANISMVLRGQTRVARLWAACAFSVLGLGLDYTLFFSGALFKIELSLPHMLSLLVELSLLVGSLLVAFFGLGALGRFVLGKHYPGKKIDTMFAIGKIGYGLLGGLLVAYVVSLFLAPIKPWWSIYLPGLHG